MDRKLFGSMALGALLGWTTLATPSRSVAGDPCIAKTFDTKLVADACKAGGKDQAKADMKAWQKVVNDRDPSRKIACKTCHTVLDPSFDLKADGLKLFRELGGS